MPKYNKYVYLSTLKALYCICIYSTHGFAVLVLFSSAILLLVYFFLFNFQKCSFNLLSILCFFCRQEITSVLLFLLVFVAFFYLFWYLSLLGTDIILLLGPQCSSLCMRRQQDKKKYNKCIFCTHIILYLYASTYV